MAVNALVSVDESNNLPLSVLSALDPQMAAKIRDTSTPMYNAISERLATMTYNVKLGGLKGNGTTDDTAALQAFLAAMPKPTNTFGNVARQLFFPAGRYILNGSFEFTDRITIRGEGPNQTYLYRKSGAQGDFFTFRGTDSGLRELTVDCNRNGKAVGDAVVLNGAYPVLSSVVVTNIDGYGIHIGKAGGAILTFMDCVRVRYASKNGIFVKAGSSSTDTIWSNMDIGLSGLSGIRVEQGSTNMSNVHVWGSGIEDTSGVDGHGFYLYSSSNMLVNCQSETNNQYGFLIEGSVSSGNALSNCRAWGNNRAGFVLKSARRGTLTGCIAHNNGVGNLDGSSTSEEYAGFLNIGSNGFCITGCQAWDSGSTLKAGEYTSGVTPVNPYLGRLSGTKTQNRAYAEMAGTANPYANKITGNQFRMQDHTLNDPLTGGVLTVGSTDTVWEANDIGNQAVPSAGAADNNMIYSRIWSNMLKVSTDRTINSVGARPAGTCLTLVFEAATPGYVTATGNVKLKAQFKPERGGTLSLICDGANWYETGRS